MLWRSHLLAGATAGIAVTGPGSVEAALASACAGGLAALLPDVDSPYSWIGRRVPALPALLKATVGHRGMLHSLMFAALAGAAFQAWQPGFLGDMRAGLLIFAGYVSHLVLDTLTPSGVPWLWPMPMRIRAPLVRTGGLLEKLVVTPALITSVVLQGVPVLRHDTVNWLDGLTRMASFFRDVHKGFF